MTAFMVQSYYIQYSLYKEDIHIQAKELIWIYWCNVLNTMLQHVCSVNLALTTCHIDVSWCAVSNWD